MIFKKSITTLICSILGASVSAANSPDVTASVHLSYAQARAQLLVASPAIKARLAKETSDQEKHEATRFLGGPKIDFNAKQVWGTKTIDMGMDTPLKDIPMTPGNPLNPIIGALGHVHIHDKQDISGPRASIDLTWPLFTGGLIDAQKKATRETALMSQAERMAEENRLEAELALAYWGVQLTRSIQTLRLDALRDLEKEVIRAKRFEKEGLIAKIERMSVEVQRDSAKRTLLESQTQVRIAEAHLNSLLGEATSPALSDPLFVVSDAIGTLEAWQKKALAHSPLLKGLESQTRVASAGVSAAKSQYSPKLYAFGSKNLVTNYLTIPEPDWIGGIGLNITLWNNRDRQSTLRSARAQESASIHMNEEASRQIKQKIEEAWWRAVQSQESYQLTTSSLALASENFRLRQKAFAEGLATADDVDRARTDLIGAQINARLAAYQFITGFVMLHASAGVMPTFASSLNKNQIITFN